MASLHKFFHSFGVLSTLVCTVSVSSFVQAQDPTNSWKAAKSIYDFTVKDIEGNDVHLSKYKGQVCIIVNVASNCGYTEGHYNGLNKLYNKYHESEGLCILGFPCNQFGSQEPGTDEDICQFAKTKNVEFDMFAKVDVNGDSAHPLFKYLKMKQSGTLGDFIKWNFTKFLVDKTGQPVARYGPNYSPEDIEEELLKLFKNTSEKSNSDEL